MSICTVAVTPRLNAARLGEMARGCGGLAGGVAASLGRAGGAASRERREVAPVADCLCNGLAAGAPPSRGAPLWCWELCDRGRGGRSSPRVDEGRCSGCAKGAASDADGRCELGRRCEPLELRVARDGGTYTSLDRCEDEGRPPGVAASTISGSPALIEKEPCRRALPLRGAGLGEGAPERLEERGREVRSSGSAWRPEERWLE